jgi:hypothetical protein
MVNIVTFSRHGRNLVWNTGWKHVYIQLNDDRLSDGHTGVYERSSMMQENNIRQTTKSTTL